MTPRHATGRHPSSRHPNSRRLAVRRLMLPTSGALAVILAAMLPAGCTTEPTATWKPEPQYTRPLPEGRSALRLLSDPARYPDFGAAFQTRDARLDRAMANSLAWFDAPSSRRAFPLAGVSHSRARESVEAMREMLRDAPDAASFTSQLERDFQVYESVGWDGDGTVLFTGYYAPIFPASVSPTSRFRYPLYRRPVDLATDPGTGAARGRRAPDGTVTPYPTRAEIERTGMLAGTELVWLEDALSAYLIHVNGSAKLRLTDGTLMYVGYAGKTDRPYSSLGKALVDSGRLDENEVGLASIRRFGRAHPEELEGFLWKNESFVFFDAYDGGRWPSGSLGVPVTAECSLATDKRIYPRGGVVLADTRTYGFDGATRRWHRFMLDQDTGGAIEAPGRADMFMGIGASAGIIAGSQMAEGRLYYLFLRPEAYSRRAGTRRVSSAGE